MRGGREDGVHQGLVGCSGERFSAEDGILWVETGVEQNPQQGSDRQCTGRNHPENQVDSPGVDDHFPAELMSTTPHRLPGYAHLRGEGLEIGAFAHPAELPAGCRTDYFDVLTVDEARSRFPEMDPDCFVTPDFLGDLDSDGLASFEDNSYSFVILNHVLEHVANPIAVLREVCRLVRTGGFLVLSVPDKNFTFDRTREVTTW